MLNLKETHPAQWLPSLQQMIKNTMFTKKSARGGLTLLSCLLGNLLFPSIAQASYAGQIQNPNDGHRITIASDTAISSAPFVGSDGKNYYRVGDPIVIKNGTSAVTSSGMVNCMGRTWGNDANYLPPGNVFHRLFIYSPPAGFNLEGQTAYRINNNFVMTIESAYIQNWANFGGSSATMCSEIYQVAQGTYAFVSQFPITFTLYIHDRIIDGQVVIPELAFAGYVRAFTDPKVPPEFNSWPLEQTSVPMRLSSSTLNIVSSCNTMTSTGQAGTVNLHHGQLNSLNYDSLVTEKVIYSCKFSMPTDVRLRLDYATDSDSQKRLPMINNLDNSKKIYSELKMTDESTGQSGNDFKVSIEDLKTITISSHLQGTNASAGDYRGSAWLIATFD